ncbi:hypothetical protein Hokovirus_1_92 [Hokovirus HKV1]|uniref:Uncharacterized protein n=1 Tax=Hokovirus HKV1 TaxID=1977638 RepID=A0A1V0SES0_9VIRU|nr:hypothetical protein Hokovirus_1_92 [Hokovirus HKV1]
MLNITVIGNRTLSKYNFIDNLLNNKTKTEIKAENDIELITFNKNVLIDQNKPILVNVYDVIIDLNNIKNMFDIINKIENNNIFIYLENKLSGLKTIIKNINKSFSIIFNMKSRSNYFSKNYVFKSLNKIDKGNIMELEYKSYILLNNNINMKIFENIWSKILSTSFTNIQINKAFDNYNNALDIYNYYNEKTQDYYNYPYKIMDKFNKLFINDNDIKMLLIIIGLIYFLIPFLVASYLNIVNLSSINFVFLCFICFYFITFIIFKYYLYNFLKLKNIKFNLKKNSYMLNSDTILNDVLYEDYYLYSNGNVAVKGIFKGNKLIKNIEIYDEDSNLLLKVDSIDNFMFVY